MLAFCRMLVYLCPDPFEETVSTLAIVHFFEENHGLPAHPDRSLVNEPFGRLMLEQ